MAFIRPINGYKKYNLWPPYGLYTASIRPLYGLYTASIRPLYGLYTASIRPLYASIRPLYGLYTASIRPLYGLYTAAAAGLPQASNPGPAAPTAPQPTFQTRRNNRSFSLPDIDARYVRVTSLVNGGASLSEHRLVLHLPSLLLLLLDSRKSPILDPPHLLLLNRHSRREETTDHSLYLTSTPDTYALPLW